MSDDKTESVGEKPRKRWRKTKWFYGIVLAYVAVTIVAAVSWSAYSHRKFREAVDPIIARGEPLAWSDFATDPIPDDQNAAILYTRALEIPLLGDSEIVYSREFSKVMEDPESEFVGAIDCFLTSPEMRRKHPEDVRKVVGMGRDVLALCRKARQLDKVDWAIDFSGKAYESFAPPGLTGYIEIASLLSLSAIEAHEAGRDDEAIEYLRDIVALGNSLTSAPALVNYLVVIAAHAFVNQSLEEILPAIKIGDAPGSASRQNLRGLMAELMDTTRCSQGVTLAMMGERSMGYDICRNILSLEMPIDQMLAGDAGGIYGSASGSSALVRSSFDFFVAPMFRLDAAWLIAHEDVYVRASRVGTLPELRRGIEQALKDSDERFANPSFTWYLSSMLTPAFERVFELHHGAMANRRLTAVAISVRMYQVDKGRRPDTLERLVPDYLAEIPQDPMDEPGRLIHYVNDPDMPRLYSVGLNGQDDHGAYDDLGKGDREGKEILFFLTGRPKRTEEESDPDASDDGYDDR